ncbi:hypothetical protein GCM10007415_09960 [Parapedobacter pyrenivorans]|uniref:Lumazine-binding n=1 Tax=Parapedobacter pyrenivorans TaxID=1305674 RepID=A0A917HHV0_9SPHI|nr:nuclear transport factor 2 family protein [Parapedobacter pyrenivorans]GGG79698.1 hypothetical protein GCM10007415_09960 [Parapedobacter pyrenivorans]
MDIEALHATTIRNYLHGAFNETDIDAFKAAFHPEFAIINILEDGSMAHFTRSMWECALKKRLEDNDFDPLSAALTARLRTVDWVGDKACATLDLLCGERVVYTDFLLLAKIAGVWQIVSKIYHQH